MPIPENQLQIWSHQGAQVSSKNTYTSIKAALANHNWPAGMDHDVYLQGSYPNATNIYGDSDVDVVVESSNVFYDDRPAILKSQMGWYEGPYTWFDFRNEVRLALTSYYGYNLVKQGNKCIKVKGDGSNRLNADVVPCCTFRHYSGTSHRASGVTFWTRDSNTQIINYPKLHLDNGSTKNSQCNNNYKPNLRVIKNARNKAQSYSVYPSYFVECLFYNVPSSEYGYNHADTFSNCLNWLYRASESNQLPGFVCQNEVQLMFGNELHQSNILDAKRLISDLIKLWNEWGQ